MLSTLMLWRLLFWRCDKRFLLWLLDRAIITKLLCLATTRSTCTTREITGGTTGPCGTGTVIPDGANTSAASTDYALRWTNHGLRCSRELRHNGLNLVKLSFRILADSVRAHGMLFVVLLSQRLMSHDLMFPIVDPSLNRTMALCLFGLLEACLQRSSRPL